MRFRILAATGLAASLVVPAFYAAPAHATVVASKPAVFRAPNTWYLKNTLAGGAADTVFAFGHAGDIPIMGDWDGNGSKTPGVIRGNTWYLKNSYAGGAADVVFAYGHAGDHFITGDWDGNGTDTPGVMRQDSTGHDHWFLRNSNTSGIADVTFDFAQSGEYTVVDTPVAGDWNNDGTDTVGRKDTDSTDWRLTDNVTTHNIDHQFRYGAAYDIVVIGDWNGDGIDSEGVVRGNTWYIRNELSDGVADTTFAYGHSGDIFLTWK